MNVDQAAHFVLVAITCAALSSWVIPCPRASSFTSQEEDTLVDQEISQGVYQSRSLLEYRHPAHSAFRRRTPVLISRFKRHPGTNRRLSKQRRKPRNKEKRSVESSSVHTYDGFHINISTCGVEKSCVRLGSPNCGHRECVYILTFTRIGDIVELELSANTKGWVAIGFSSDQKMGGDDVIACIHSPIPSKIRASALINPYAHEKPQEKNIPLNLTAVEYKDGYTSCRVRRAIALEGAMDLTNDWYQLYAWGSVVSNGLMSRHDLEKPPTSAQTYSMLRKDINIVQRVNSAGCVKISVVSGMVMFLLLILPLD